MPKASNVRRAATHSFVDAYNWFGHALAAAEAVPYRERKKKWDRALKRCDYTGRRLLSMPAKSIDEMLSKICVAAYFSDRATPIKFGLEPNWEPGNNAPTELLALASLRDDLRRLKRGKVRIAS